MVCLALSLLFLLPRRLLRCFLVSVEVGVSVVCGASQFGVGTDELDGSKGVDNVECNVGCSIGVLTGCGMCDTDKGECIHAMCCCTLCITSDATKLLGVCTGVVAGVC